MLNSSLSNDLAKVNTKDYAGYAIVVAIVWLFFYLYASNSTYMFTVLICEIYLLVQTYVLFMFSLCLPMISLCPAYAQPLPILQ